jgi:thiamine-monophosphate kinase
MGATPNNFTLALTMPELSQAWLQSFSENLAAAAQAYQITLAGGDTSRGPLTLSVQVQGFVDSGCALLRSGANSADVICVTGTLGDSRAGLSLLDDLAPNADQQYLLDRFYRPVPRVSSGLLINQYASACIDISDGLLADLGHILDSSNKGAKIDSAAIPLSPQLKKVAGDKALQWALSGGEDFELCFTLSADNWQLLQRDQQRAELGVAICKIGVITEQLGLQISSDDTWQSVTATGFQHFYNQ